MTDHDIIQEKLVHLKTRAPKGFALALHVKFTAPTFLFQSFSIGGFARDDRPYTPEETAELRDLLDEIHNLTDQMKELSPEMAGKLHALSINFTRPQGG